MGNGSEKEPQADQDKPWHDYTLGEMAQILQDNPGDGALRKKLITGLMEGAGVTEWCWGMLWGAQRTERGIFGEFTVYRGDPTVLRGLVGVLHDKITRPSQGLEHLAALYGEET